MPVDYLIRQETSTIQVSKNSCCFNRNSTVELSFCGEGPSDGAGAILSKVSLLEQSKCKN